MISKVVLKVYKGAMKMFVLPTDHYRTTALKIYNNLRTGRIIRIIFLKVLFDILYL